MNPLESFPERLKNYRKMKGWRQDELAKKLGYSLDTISSWERGKRTPQGQQIPHLAEQLNIAPEELLKSINATHYRTHLHKDSVSFVDEEEQELKSEFETQGEIQRIYLNRSQMSLEFSYPRMLGEARDILVVGISLNAIAMNYSRGEIIHSIVGKKNSYTLCFLDPDSVKCAEREQEEEYAESGIAALTRLNIYNMLRVRKHISRRNPECVEQLKIMTYDLPPRYNIYMFDDKLMTVQSYAYSRGEDTPTFVLKRQSENGLFEFYASVACHIVEQSKPVSE